MMLVCSIAPVSGVVCSVSIKSDSSAAASLAADRCYVIIVLWNRCCDKGVAATCCQL